VKNSRRSSRPSRPKRLPLPRRPLEWGLAIVAVALVAIAIGSLGSGSSSSSAASKRTSTVGKGVVQSTVSGNGTLEPAQKVELSFGASGEVTAIYAKAGDTVKKGQVLAEVDSSSARASLASAEAQLIEAEEAVETAAEAEEEAETEETAYEGGTATTVFVGLMSEKGTAAATVEGETASPEEVEKEESEGEEEVAKEGAKKGNGGKATPTKVTEEGSGQSEGAKESAGSKTGSAAAGATDGSTGGGETPSSGGASEASGATSSGGGAETSAAAAGGSEAAGGTATGGASVSLPTAEANLREAQLSVKSARQEVRETTLRAPISGTIASVSGVVGETVSGGSSGGGTSEASTPGAIGGESTSSSSSSSSAFMVLAQLHRLKLEVSFSEADIGKVRTGQTATVAVDSLEGTELAGEVTKLSVLPSEGSSSVVEYPATILLTQSAKGLRAGMSASAEVVVEQVKNAVTVPSEAISQAGGGKTVTVEEDGKEVTKTITTGLVGDETTEVVSGLKAGATLVLPEVTVATATPTGGGEEEAGGFPSFGGAGGGTGGFTPPAGAGFPGAP
jgi:multidrug efflux pump subunit AcrA (membrane-fusion protein)